MHDLQLFNQMIGKPPRAVSREDLIANYGLDGRLTGMEVLNASRVLGPDSGRPVFEVAPALVAVTPAA